MTHSHEVPAASGDLWFVARRFRRKQRAKAPESIKTLVLLRCRHRQTGAFARDWILENQARLLSLSAMRRKDAEHPIEEVGHRMHKML
ncbi:hypothetical protein KSD_15790 [Ktedonobacter sp. SOSP1-85]|uniref:hypothetical protein n=1 Tax=Ktedonobacter sp. SOSP1-85 TaxID=2778367 RepID=UPI00191616E1|nr:hypothetical protein [Ktedonobacter sp. SOSP1-85]GHO73808.1 hypothetical protein KSD_15790 [Ktedonobacter sp. SOSP1-85]